MLLNLTSISQYLQFAFAVEASKYGVSANLKYINRFLVYRAPHLHVTASGSTRSEIVYA